MNWTPVPRNVLSLSFSPYHENRPYTKWEATIYFCLAAHHKTRKDNFPITYCGEILGSMKEWETKLHWRSWDKTRRFLSQLIEAGLIELTRQHDGIVDKRGQFYIMRWPHLLEWGGEKIIRPTMVGEQNKG